MCIISTRAEASEAEQGKANEHDIAYQAKALSAVLDLFNTQLQRSVKCNVQYLIQEGKLSLFVNGIVQESILNIDDIATFEVTKTGIRIICRQPFKIFILTHNQIVA